MTWSTRLSEVYNTEYRLIVDDKNNQNNIKTKDRFFSRHSFFFSSYLGNRNAVVVSIQQAIALYTVLKPTEQWGVHSLADG